MVVLRLLICDDKFKGGVCYFDMIWHQPKNLLSAPSVDLTGLILTFYQVSRSFGDGGDEAFACFEEKRIATNTVKMRIPSGVSRSFNAKRSKLMPVSLYFYSYRHDNLIAAMFVDDKAETEKGKDFLHEILKEFEEKYSEKMKELAPTIQHEMTNQQNTQIRLKFAEFETTADRLKTEKFGANQKLAENESTDEDSEGTDGEEEDEQRIRASYYYQMANTPQLEAGRVSVQMEHLSN